MALSPPSLTISEHRGQSPSEKGSVPALMETAELGPEHHHSRRWTRHAHAFRLAQGAAATGRVAIVTARRELLKSSGRERYLRGPWFWWRCRARGLFRPGSALGPAKRATRTGHAVQQGMPETPQQNRVLVLFGDVPLLRPATLRRLIDQCGDDEVAVLTVDVDEPFGYGRILRQHGRVVGIVEEGDASDEQKKITEINTGEIGRAHV